MTRRRLFVGFGAMTVLIVFDAPARSAGVPLFMTEQGRLFQADGVTTVQVGGDIIIAVNGRRVLDATALEDDIVADNPGRRVRLRIVRGSRQLTVTVTLGRRPSVLPTSG